MYNSQGPRMQLPFILAEDSFIDIIIDLDNSITTELFVNPMDTPPRKFIVGAISVTPQVPPTFLSREK